MQVATEKDFLEAVNKVIKGYAKFSSTPKYMTYVVVMFAYYCRLSSSYSLLAGTTNASVGRIAICTSLVCVCVCLNISFLHNISISMDIVFLYNAHCCFWAAVALISAGGLLDVLLSAVSPFTRSWKKRRSAGVQ